MTLVEQTHFSADGIQTVADMQTAVTDALAQFPDNEASELSITFQGTGSDTTVIVFITPTP